MNTFVVRLLVMYFLNELDLGNKIHYNDICDLFEVIGIRSNDKYFRYAIKTMARKVVVVNTCHYCMNMYVGSFCYDCMPPKILGQSLLVHGNDFDYSRKMVSSLERGQWAFLDPMSWGEVIVTRASGGYHGLTYHPRKTDRIQMAYLFSDISVGTLLVDNVVFRSFVESGWVFVRSNPFIDNTTPIMDSDHWFNTMPIQSFGSITLTCWMKRLLHDQIRKLTGMQKRALGALFWYHRTWGNRGSFYLFIMFLRWAHFSGVDKQEDDIAYLKRTLRNALGTRADQANSKRLLEKGKRILETYGKHVSV